MKAEEAQASWIRVAACSAELLGADAGLIVLAARTVAAHNLALPVPWQQGILRVSAQKEGPFAWDAPAGTRLGDGREFGSGIAVRLGSGQPDALVFVRARERQPFAAPDLSRLGALELIVGQLVEAQSGVEGATALLAVLAEAAGAPEMHDLLDRVVDGAARSLGASGASIMLLDERGDLRIRASRGLPDDVVQGARRRPGEGISGYVVKSGEPLLLAGPVQDWRFRGVDPGIDGSISVPLLGSRGVLGALNLRRKASGPAFTAGDLTLAMGLARVLAGTLEKVQDTGQAEGDRRQALSLYELGRLRRGATDEKEVLSTALMLVCDYFEATVGVVAERLGEGRWLALALRGAEANGEHDSGVLERVWRERRAVALRGSEVEGEQAPWWKAALAYVGAPLGGADARGVLLLGRQGARDFASVDIGFAETLGMEIGNLWLDVRKSRDECARAAAEERQRIAQELHDSLAQELSGLVLAIEGSHLALARDSDAARRQLEKAVRTARACLRDVRQYMAGLRSQEGITGDVAVQLRRVVDEFRRQGLNVDTRLEGNGTKLHGELQRTLSRVAQEALTNAQKHAKAAKVTVVLSQSAEGCELVVQDNGVGFAAAEVMERAPNEGRYGLLGMRERAESVGGQFAVHSAPGQGTRIELKLSAERSLEEVEAAAGVVAAAPALPELPAVAENREANEVEEAKPQKNAQTRLLRFPGLGRK